MSNHYSPVGVPQELVFELPSSMIDSRKIEERIQPYSLSSYNTSGQVAKFTIPQTDRKLLNGQTMYLTGRLTLSGLSGSALSSYAMLGSFYSLFSRQVINANGSVLETIESPGELVNLLLNMTMNGAEKVAQSNSLGCANYADTNNIDQTNNIGFKLGVNSSLYGQGKVQYFAIPIIGVLDAVKYIPMWNSNIDIELTINSLAKWLVPCEVITTLAGTETFTIDNLELVFDSIELTPESFNMVMASYPQKVVLKSQSYVAGTGGLSQNSGGQDIAINARLQSMKQLFFYFNQGTALADLTYGGINPNGNDVVFISNGKYYPQRPIKLTNPADVYMQIQKSFGSIKSYSHSGAIGKTELLRRDTVDTTSCYNAPILSGVAGAVLVGGNKFYLSIDTETINTNKNSLYNGITTGVNSTIRLNVASALSNATTCMYWCCYDVLLEFDFTTGITRSIY